MSQGSYLSRDGYDKLVKELEHLKSVKRRQLSKAVGEARGHGDLTENAEYDAAKEAQALNEKRIAELERKLAASQIIDEESMSTDEVLIGATVKLKDIKSGKELTYTLVAEEEADYAQGKISISSPVGGGLLGHREGEVVEINVPAGALKYQILKISR
jgi:transcription elongation factor GreA